LGDAFRVGAGEREPATELPEQRGADAGCILEAAEDVATDRDIGGERLRISSPLGRERVVIARTVLVAEAARVVAGMEGLALGIGREDEQVRHGAGAEAVLKLRRQISPRPTGLVEGRVGGIILGADIDNRLKTIFDALRIPHSADEAGSDTNRPDPFFCVLEDDSLITNLSVNTRELLRPATEHENADYAELTIHVAVKIAN